jgi:hypothetical protein
VKEATNRITGLLLCTDLSSLEGIPRFSCSKVGGIIRRPMPSSRKVNLEKVRGIARCGVSQVWPRGSAR